MVTPGQGLAIGPEDPRTPDVRALLERHLATMHAQSPPEDVHALDVEGLLDPAVRLVGCREPGGALLAVGALRLEPGQAELKSMHTAAEARGRGVARLVLAHLLDLARTHGARRVSLETGSQPGFAPARELYRSAGFVECGPFGSYAASPSSTFMTLELG